MRTVPAGAIGTAVKLPVPPTQPVDLQLLQANATFFFSGKVKRMHPWILHEEKEGNIFFMNINEQTVSRNLKYLHKLTRFYRGGQFKKRLCMARGGAMGVAPMIVSHFLS